jgi:hypothetical protein
MKEKEYTLGSIISVFVIFNVLALVIAAIGYLGTF